MTLTVTDFRNHLSDSSTPNKETLQAIEQARSGRYEGTINTSSYETFIRSVMN